MKNKICAVTMIKAPLKDTLNFVNYHLNIGIDHVFMLFDNPKDKAIDALKDYKKVTCLKGNKKYWNKLTSDPNLKEVLKNIGKGNMAFGVKSQLTKKKSKKDLVRVEKQALNANYIFNLAKEKGYKWIVHLDGDELIYTEKPLKKILLELSEKTDVLRIPSLEGVPEKFEYKNVFAEVNLFRDIEGILRFYYKYKKTLGKIIPLIKEKEGKLKKIYFKSHAAGKSIIKISDKIQEVGIHEPAPKKGIKLNYAFSKNVHLLHFDNCSFKDWKRKWVRMSDGTVTAIAIPRYRLEMIEEFVEASKGNDKNKLKELYKKQYFIPEKKKKILERIGVLRRIKIDKRLFYGTNNL